MANIMRGAPVGNCSAMRLAFEKAAKSSPNRKGVVRIVTKALRSKKGVLFRPSWRLIRRKPWRKGNVAKQQPGV